MMILLRRQIFSGLAAENMENEKTNYTLKLILRAAKSFWDS